MNNKSRKDKKMKILKKLLGIKEVPYLKCAGLVKKVSQDISEERGSKCGYDLLCGMAEGDVKGRYEAWVRYIKEIENKESHTDAERNGVWVPAIFNT
jgi:hypothetical protein